MKITNVDYKQSSRPNLLIIFGLLLFLSCSSWAQDVSNIDSLKQKLESSSNPEEKIELLVSIIGAYSGIDDEKAMQYARTAMIEAENTDDEEGKANLFYIIGGLYKTQGNYDKSIENHQASLDIYTALNIESEVAKLHYNLGDIYKKKGLYQLSLENCLKGMLIYERLNDSAGLADVYNCMGSLHKYQKDYTKSIEYYNRSLNLSIGINDRGGMALSYNNIGVVYAIMGNTDLALDQYNHSLEMFIETGSKKNQGILLGNIASIYLTQNEYDKALEYINRSLNIHNEIAYTNGQARQYQNLGRYYDLTQNSDLAIENLMKAFKLFETLGRLENKKEVASSLSDIYRKNGQFKEAYEYFSLFKEISDSIFNIEMMMDMSQMEYEYKWQKEEEIHDLKDQKRWIINTAFFFALVFIIAIIILSYSRLKIKNRHQYLEFQNIELEKKQMEIDLELRHRELAANTIYHVKKNEVISSVVKRLKVAKKNLKKKNVPVINSIISDLSSSIDSDIWEDFETRFLKVHKGFYDNLQERFPELTTNEKRISAFLRLDMSTKEISFITNQTPHSINIARTRLRKKLGLANKDINLSAFLSHF